MSVGRAGGSVVGRFALCCLVIAGALVASGCRREEVAAYDAPKDQGPPPPPTHAAGPGSLPEDMPPRPSLTWKSLPEGWVSKGASGMRVANFSVPSPDGASADLAVIPLPGTGGSDLDLVNLWRGQLGLTPIGEADLPKHTEETSLGQETIRLFHIVGEGSADASAAGNQILVAALRKGGSTWFFKLGGPAAAVAANKDRLKTFLGQVEFGAPAAETAAPFPVAQQTPPAGGPAAPSGPASAQWDTPASWTSVAPPQMIHRKWTAAVEGGAKADVTVSVFPGETGGLVANLNRWRGQVGLKPASEQELTPMIQTVDVLGGSATLVDFVGTSPESGDASRLVAMIVRRDGSSWFYKLLGPPKAVESHRDSFVKFVQSARYSKGS